MGYNTDDPQDIHRGLSGKPPLEYLPGRKPRSRKERLKHARNNTDEKGQTLDLASPDATHVAEGFMAAAEDYGYALPYNANWLAHQISAKVIHDPEMQPLLQTPRHNDVVRWLDKMVERYWAEYVSNSIKPKNVLFDFLDEAWDDLRYYSHACLRGAYLKKYGRKIPPKEYGDHRETGLYKALQKIRMEEAIQKMEESPAEPVPENWKLTEHHKAVVKSWKTRREAKLSADEEEEQDALPTPE